MRRESTQAFPGRFAPQNQGKPPPTPRPTHPDTATPAGFPTKHCTKRLSHNPVFVHFCCPAPPGAGGLKLQNVGINHPVKASCPTRARWRACCCFGSYCKMVCPQTDVGFCGLSCGGGSIWHMWADVPQVKTGFHDRRRGRGGDPVFWAFVSLPKAIKERSIRGASREWGIRHRTPPDPPGGGRPRP